MGQARVCDESRRQPIRVIADGSGTELCERLLLQQYGYDRLLALLANCNRVDLHAVFCDGH